jgi:hypothetical protein
VKRLLLAAAALAALPTWASASEFFTMPNGRKPTTQEAAIFDMNRYECIDWGVHAAGHTVTYEQVGPYAWQTVPHVHSDQTKIDELIMTCMRAKGYELHSSSR